MIDSTTSSSLYGNFQAFGGSQLVDSARRQPAQPELPTEPGPVEQLREALEKTSSDTEALAAQSSQVLAARNTEDVVSQSGVANISEATEAIANKRVEAATARLSSSFGEGAAAFVSENGQIDRPGLQQFLSDQNNNAQLPSDEDLFDLRETSGYGPNAEAVKTRVPNFLSVIG